MVTDTMIQNFTKKAAKIKERGKPRKNTGKNPRKYGIFPIDNDGANHHVCSVL
jgi:hypothetical protein